MKQTINQSQFIDQFARMDRSDNFSYDGKVALFEYIEQYEEDCGTEIELDVVALCCEYTEYENLEEFHANYNKSDYPDMESIQDNTQVITWSDTPEVDGFIILDF